jgi:SNF2 family DNA or RNA helicase
LSFLDARPRAFDNSDPGTGKTAGQVLHYAARQNRKRWLVLCPKTLMTTAWGEDIMKFAPRLTVSYAYAEVRDEAFRFDTDVVVMNHDGVKHFFHKGKPNKEGIKFLKDFDHLTIDEYTAFKHHTSQRSKSMAYLRQFFSHRYGMSGTPNPNSVMELWHPTLVMDDGKRLGTSYFKLRNNVQVPTQIGPSAQHVRWDDKPGAAQWIDAILADITIRHVFEDVMTHVPPNHRDFKDFSLSKRAKGLYDRMENDCILALKDATVTAVHAASLRTKLLQIASGAVYDGSEDRSYQVIDPQRYELIADLVEERDHSVTFFNWKHQRDLLCKEFEKRGLSFALIDGDTPARSRDKIVEDYQKGTYRTLLLHPRTGAHGLTLTRGTTTIIASPIYEADLLRQAIHRIYRGDQKMVTNTILVRAKGTVEDLVYDRLNAKGEAMADLLQLMAMRHKT